MNATLIVTSPKQSKQRDISSLLRRALGPFDDHCAAAIFGQGGNNCSSSAYVTAPLIGAGISRCTASPLLDRIVAFDRAEASSANLTQTNLVQVSSFNGPNGLLLGYDLLRQELSPHPLLERESCYGGGVEVHDLAPLLSATEALLGTVAQPRFPILPGQHLLCAYKTLYQEGPCTLYGSLAVAVAEDRTRNADLFLEDHAELTMNEDTEQQERSALVRLVDAAGQISQNLSVRYSRIFVGVRPLYVPQGHVGCVLTAAPYLLLPQNAVPEPTDDGVSSVDKMAAMSLSEWERLTLWKDRSSNRASNL